MPNQTKRAKAAAKAAKRPSSKPVANVSKTARLAAAPPPKTVKSPEVNPPVAKSQAPKQAKRERGPFLVAACDPVLKAAATKVAKEKGYPSLTAYLLGTIAKDVREFEFAQLVRDEFDALPSKEARAKFEEDEALVSPAVADIAGVAVPPAPIKDVAHAKAAHVDINSLGREIEKEIASAMEAACESVNESLQQALSAARMSIVAGIAGIVTDCLEPAAKPAEKAAPSAKPAENSGGGEGPSREAVTGKPKLTRKQVVFINEHPEKNSKEARRLGAIFNRSVNQIMEIWQGRAYNDYTGRPKVRTPRSGTPWVSQGVLGDAAAKKIWNEKPDSGRVAELLEENPSWTEKAIQNVLSGETYNHITGLPKYGGAPAAAEAAGRDG